MLDMLRTRRRATLTIVVLVGAAGVAFTGLAGSDASRRPDPRRIGAEWAAGRLPAASTTATTTATTAPAPPPGPATTVAPPVTAPPVTAPPAPRPVGRRPVPPPRPAQPAPPPAATSLAAAWIAAGAQNIAPDAAPAAPPDAGARRPVRVEIPSIGVSAPVDPAGLNGDGTMQVPEDFARTHWYTGRPIPGDPGPAIIVGHVDNRRGPAVFYRLKELGPGDEVIVRRADGGAVTFVVERSKQVPKSAFPTEEVYGPTPDPQLRLVTCGGSFDRSTRHYRDNIIVFLRLKV